MIRRRSTGIANLVALEALRADHTPVRSEPRYSTLPPYESESGAAKKADAAAARERKAARRALQAKLAANGRKARTDV